MLARWKRFTVTPQAYSRVALAALAVLTAIVLTGAAVRVTGSGLGCPDWPTCYEEGRLTPELGTHQLVEFGNRLMTAVVGIPSIAAFLLAFKRRPYRRDLVWLSAFLPLGVLAQAILGGLTVLYDLRPGFVMGHYLLSMAVLVAAVALVYRARREPDEPPVIGDRITVMATRALLPLGTLVIFAGTVATAAGPHAGGSGTGDVVERLSFKGADTVDWTIHQHGRTGTALGVLALFALMLAHRRGAPRGHIRALEVLILLLAAQGVVGLVQYSLDVPAELVWVHVALATATWLALLWAVAQAGRPAPRLRDAPEQPAARLETAAH